MSGWLAIVNPHSGGSGAQARLQNLLRRLKGLVEKIVLTEYPGHAAEIAKAATNYRGVAAVGGDGTLFEILKGLDRTRQCVAVFPAGRGNSLARDLGFFGKIPSPEEIGRTDPLHIDLMEVTVRNSAGLEAQNLSASTVAIGYPVAITTAARGFPRHLGKFSYAAATTFVRRLPLRLRFRAKMAPGSTPTSGFLSPTTRATSPIFSFSRTPAATMDSLICWNWMPVFSDRASTICPPCSDRACSAGAI